MEPTQQLAGTTKNVKESFSKIIIAMLFRKNLRGFRGSIPFQQGGFTERPLPQYPRHEEESGIPAPQSEGRQLNVRENGKSAVRHCFSG